MGRGQEAIRRGFILSICPKETEHGWKKGDHRGDKTALGGIPEVAGALIPVIRSPRQTKFLEAEFRGGDCDSIGDVARAVRV
jgi:hypothetical protein